MSTQNDQEKISPAPMTAVAPVRRAGFASNDESDRQDRIVAWIVIFGALALAVLMTASMPH